MAGEKSIAATPKTQKKMPCARLPGQALFAGVRLEFAAVTA